MDIKVKKADPLKQKTPCLVLAVYEGKLATSLLKDLDRALGGALGRAGRAGEFAGKHRQTLMLHGGPALAAERVLLVGLGKEKGSGFEHLRQAAGTAGTFLQERKITGLSVGLESFAVRGDSPERRAQAVTEGLLLGTYRFDRYRKEKAE